MLFIFTSCASEDVYRKETESIVKNTANNIQYNSDKSNAEEANKVPPPLQNLTLNGTQGSDNTTLFQNSILH